MTARGNLLVQCASSVVNITQFVSRTDPDNKNKLTVFVNCVHLYALGTGQL